MSQLAALCAVTSFLWLAYNLEHHQTIERPRVSAILVFIVAAGACYLAGFCAAWLPGPNGRFDDEPGPLKGARTPLPRKPRRFFLPGLVACVVVRLELFHRVSLDLQCSQPGVEAFLPLLILLYELMPGRRTRLRTSDDDETDPDDPGLTIFEALGIWFSESKSSLTIGILLLSWGAYLASSQPLRSTFFCSSHDGRYLVIFFQWLGLFLDATIAILLWRVLAWTRTTKLRLRALSSILLASSLGTVFLTYSSSVLMPANPVAHRFKGIGSLYLFDVVIDGLVLSAFLISTSLLAIEGSPLSIVGIISFLSGLLLAVNQTRLTGTWENPSPSSTYISLLLICVGFMFFVYANNIRTVVLVPRALVVFLLFVLVITASIYTPISANHVFDTHPLSKQIYDARVEADRWLIHASSSDSLQAAVREYRERHDGRDPPPNFDKWYNFAKERHSVIIDHFAQMQKDLSPFWGISPSKIREDVRRAAENPDMALLKIQNGKAQHNLPPANPHKSVMDKLVELIEVFVEHLPDMELAINMAERPRVLAPWRDIQRFTKAGRRRRVTKLLPTATDASRGEMPIPQLAVHDTITGGWDSTSVTALREMTALTCPAGTKGRSGAHWDIRDICTTCIRPHSNGQYLGDWSLSQELCHQSDLLCLHSYYMTPPDLSPTQELLPVFSMAKTDSYSDILIPLFRIAKGPKPTTEGFGMKWKTLFWRGKVDRRNSAPELLRGGHQERLVHTVNNATGSDMTTLVLPVSGNGGKFVYERVPTARLNALLPMDIAFSNYSACKAPSDGGCAALAGEFQTKPDAEPLRHQYVLVMDTDSGPARDFATVLSSNSVPFYATIFKHWYSERMMPWVHFVPIDLRFHALHSTLAYFVGIHEGKDNPESNGKGIQIVGRQDNAQWIADQGRIWASKALRREDVEIYWFRVLLEWGRITSDDRDQLGYVL